MLLKLAKELTRKEKEERKQLPLNCSPTQLIERILDAHVMLAIFSSGHLLFVSA